MKWTPDRLAIVAGVGFVALVALGVDYVVHADPGSTPVSTTVVGATPASGTSTAPATGPATGPATAPATASGTPTGSATPSLRISVPTLHVTPRPGRRPAAAPRPSAAPPAVLDFTLGTFNVLGASHTSGSGKRPGMASGAARAVRAAALLRKHGDDVVGFQELQTSQLATLQRTTNLDFYPGFTMRRMDSENSLGWRRDTWVAVEKHTVRIPYFDGGGRAMPFVKLRSLSTGLEAWFANFHNPAETAQFHHQQRFREAATRIESNLANVLISTTRLPVFITGDMNERAPYFCRLTAHAPMIAARGGTNNGRCLAGAPRAVDWIFGSQGVVFTGYDEDRSHLVDITTDHPVVTARVRITGRPGQSLTGGN